MGLAPKYTRLGLPLFKQLAQSLSKEVKHSHKRGCPVDVDVSSVDEVLLYEDV